MLKFAAIGVMSVPQKPESMPIAVTMVDVAAERCTIERQRDPGRHHRERGEGVAHQRR